MSDNINEKLWEAAKDGRYEEAAACIARADPTWTLQGRSALHWTARDGHVRVAELLLDHGWDLEARTSAGQRPLHEAARCGRVEVMQLLAARGAEINSQDSGKETPLHCAVLQGWVRLQQSRSYSASVLTQVSRIKRARPQRMWPLVT